MNTIRKVLAGFEVPPAVVAMLRGIVEAFLLAVVGVGIYWLNDSHIPAAYLPMAPFALYFLRQLEGIIDQKIDPAQNRMPPLAEVTPNTAATIVKEVHEENGVYL